MVCSTVAGLIALLLFSPTVHAEDSIVPPSASRATPIRTSIEKIRFDVAASPLAAPQIRFQQHRPMSTATRISVGFVGGFVGFFGGGLLGAAIEPSCHCDDPGLKGFVIGAPIGAVVGAISAFKLVSP